MFSLIGAIIIGFFAGLIARAVHPGDDKAGFIVTTVLGIIGSLLATYLGRWMGWYADGEAAGFIMSVVGAVLVLFIYNLIMRKRHQV
ncbi:transglycosylase [Alkanindiges hydrocarboniclasticus]|jgi:uncharacterized membrane protein YeaQ/YmgE (transglycosylase-associated protein family)|uniref:Transglycosylase n=1 Tax=Alkanindiges hydrocarboniclasticus TaxID=1907941 RepID=A0A1S8CW85_9GAMM|nr:GlsB/YeaQ/YmgE family stress response membrane protein [Alkanindiges hydrocarboniclasticus]ONG40999.1 transglycosylase [Alkanindiges hydrocarboniclasticus]